MGYPAVSGKALLASALIPVAIVSLLCAGEPTIARNLPIGRFLQVAAAIAAGPVLPLVGALLKSEAGGIAFLAALCVPPVALLWFGFSRRRLPVLAGGGVLWALLGYFTSVLLHEI